MTEARLCSTEKAAVMIGWAIGVVSGQSILALVDVGLFALAASYLVILWATFASFRTVYNRREDAFIAQLEDERAQRRTHVYDEISRRGGLTPRERQVMEMLAQGYTRPYICEKLGISDGTARAHAFHVYQKLGVHKKDDLLRLVRDVEREAPKE